MSHEKRVAAGKFRENFERMVAELEVVAATGDPTAQYDLSILEFDLAMERRSWDHFNRAESLTRSAAEAGLPAAVDSLANWEALRNAFQRRLQGESAA